MGEDQDIDATRSGSTVIHFLRNCYVADDYVRRGLRGAVAELGAASEE